MSARTAARSVATAGADGARDPGPAAWAAATLARRAAAKARRRWVS